MVSPDGSLYQGNAALQRDKPSAVELLSGQYSGRNQSVAATLQWRAVAECMHRWNQDGTQHKNTLYNGHA